MVIWYTLYRHFPKIMADVNFWYNLFLYVCSIFGSVFVYSEKPEKIEGVDMYDM